jgi:hypothetical protein
LSLSLSFLAAFHIIPFAEKAERVPSADSGAAHHRSGGNRDHVEGGLQAALGKLNIGTINVGSTQNLAAELLRAMATINATIVPYRTTPDAMIAVLRNDVQLTAEYYATTKAGIEDGKLRLLATTGAKRSEFTPNAPTAAEAGVPGYEVRSWNALFAKAGTSADIIASQPGDPRRGGVARYQTTDA